MDRRFHPRFDAELLTSCQKDRWFGARIKHRMKNNWLKMYDKFGLVLRIETVIKNPREFRVRRLRTRERRSEMAWCPMNKGLINMYRYREIALAANEHYLNALSAVENPVPVYRHVEKITEPVVKTGRSYSGFNPASGLDVKLLEAVLDGESMPQVFPPAIPFPNMLPTDSTRALIA
jgi:hypothetical protein